MFAFLSACRVTFPVKNNAQNTIKQKDKISLFENIEMFLIYLVSSQNISDKTFNQR